MKHTAVLVHGTFAQGAPWTRPGSAVIAELQNSLPGTWTIEHFDWTGANSYSAREQAASELAEHLDSLVADSRNSRAIVVAHSHGGNVALRALRRMKRSDQIAAVVALGTPFLQIEHKRWSPPLLYAMSAAAWLTITINSLSGGLVNLMGGWGSLSLVAAFLTFSLALYFPLRRAKEAAKTISIASYRPDSGNVPLLIVRHSFDEAGFWLRALLVPRFFEGILNIFGRMFVGNNWFIKLLWVFGLSLIMVIIGITFAPLLDIFFIGSIAILLTVPPLSAIATLLCAHKFGFGGRLSLKHLFVQVTLASKMHVQGAQVAQFSGVAGIIRAATAKSGRPPTPHSLGYSDPKALTKVTRWLNAIL